MSVLITDIQRILNTIPLSTALCAICDCTELVVPCITCNRYQCEACFAQEDTLLLSCKGCRIENDLEMDFPFMSPLSEKQMVKHPEQEQEQELEKQENEPISPRMTLPPHPDTMFLQPHPNAYLTEHMEIGLRPFEGILYPTLMEWKHAENILVNHIYFTMNSYGIQPPWIFTKYLVGQMIHHFPNQSVIATDYMLSYEPDFVNPGHYHWRKYMSTYYNRSPIPYDENIFFPYPLPLQFHL